MQSPKDAERVINLGAPEKKVTVTGNMKFDVDISADAGRQETLKRSLGLADDHMLLVAGSTHRGEEAAVLEAFKKLYAELPRLKLLIAPRHIERSGEVEDAVRSSGFDPVRVSSIRNSNVFILDTIGQLRDVYSVATVVFIGGSLVPHGGQNPVEPAALGRPVIFGPHMFNFREISAALLDSGAAVQIKDPDGLFDSIKMLLADPGKRLEMAKRAGLAIAGKRGATQRNLKEIEKFIA